MNRGEVVKAALDAPEELDDWQYDFVNKIADYESLDHLTPLQVAALESIAAKLGMQL